MLERHAAVVLCDAIMPQPESGAGLDPTSRTDTTDKPRAGDSTWKTDREVAVDELTWYYLSSDAELGEHSAWESLITAALTGGSRGPRLEHWADATALAGVDGEVTMPVPPARQIRAAARQSRILAALGRVTHANRLLIANVITPKRNTQLDGVFGKTLGPVVRYLADTKQLKVNYAADGEEKRKIEQVAEARWNTALDEYNAAKYEVAILRQPTRRARSLAAAE